MLTINVTGKSIYCLMTAVLIILISAPWLSAKAFPSVTAAEYQENLGADNEDLKIYEIVYHGNDKKYLSYSQAIREKIKESIKRNYARYYEDGDVTLFFILKSDGKLARFDIDRENSTKNNKLLKIAVSSLNESVPFSPFPEGLSFNELSFHVTISFK